MITIPSNNEIKIDILDNMTTDVSRIEGTYSYDIASANSKAVYDNYVFLQELFPQLFPFFATDSVYLDEHMTFFGLTRRAETKATGNVIFSGNEGATIDIGTIVISKTGERYKLLELVTIDSEGIGSGTAEAENGGTVGNLGVGDIVTMEISIPNVFNVTNEVAFNNGYPIEAVESCWSRMKGKASKPAHSGNKNDYINWAKEVEGVGKVTVLGSGEEVTTGVDVPLASVYVYITDYDLLPVTTLVDTVKDYIEDDRRPVGANVSVISFTGIDINVAVEVKLSGTETLADVTTSFENYLNLNFKSEDFVVDNVVSIGKIGRMLFDIQGVLDYRNLTINLGSASIVVEKIETANLGTVGVSEWI